MPRPKAYVGNPTAKKEQATRRIRSAKANQPGMGLLRKGTTGKRYNWHAVWGARGAGALPVGGVKVAAMGCKAVQAVARTEGRGSGPTAGARRVVVMP